MTLREILAGHASAEIVCLYRGVVVRRIVVVDGTADIEAPDVSIGVSLDVEITHRPWFMDRGDLLIDAGAPLVAGPRVGSHAAPGETGRFFKLATVADIIRFPDGTERHLPEPRDTYKPFT